MTRHLGHSRGQQGVVTEGISKAMQLDEPPFHLKTVGEIRNYRRVAETIHVCFAVSFCRPRQIVDTIALFGK